LVNDYLVHLLRLHERVESEYSQQLSPHIREVVSAYADGFNFFAYWHPTKIIAGDLFPISPQGTTPCSVLFCYGWAQIFNIDQLFLL